MRLSKLIEGISGIGIENYQDIEITSVTAESDKCRAGSLFVAINGSKFNGNDFILQAYKRGARVFVSSEKMPILKNTTLIFSEYPRKTLAELCANLNGNPQKKMLFIGITGTKGKTTTAVLLSNIFNGIGVKNAVIGTLGIIGAENISTKNTTPDPTVLFPVLKNAYRKGCKVVILEVSSQALKDYRVYGIPFDCVAFTGLGHDHVGAEEHPSVSDYIFSKRSLFCSYGAKRAVVNVDDAYSLYMTSEVPKVVKCGLSSNADLVIMDYTDSPSGSKFTLCGVPITCSLPGIYNARNVSVALALACEVTGRRICEISKYVSSATVPGRINYINLSGRNVVIDYAHNKESMREIINLSKRMFKKKIICVFGSVGGRSFARRRELAQVSEELADLSVITSDNPCYEFPLSICADIYSSFKDKTKAKIIVDREEAINYAIHEAEKGDSVLILGKGHETSINVCGKCIPFSDEGVVEKLKREAL